MTEKSGKSQGILEWMISGNPACDTSKEDSEYTVPMHMSYST